MIRFFLTFTFIFFVRLTFAQLSSQGLRNLMTFAKLSGYVQYFHPSDESRKIEWQAFTLYGSQQVMQLKHDGELIDTLSNMFKVIAPTVKIFKSGHKAKDFPYIPEDTSKLYQLSWQHLGFNLPLNSLNWLYSSKRLHRVDPRLLGESRQDSQADSLFPMRVKDNEYRQKELVPGISCVIPLSLYADDSATYPKVDSALVVKLQADIMKKIPKQVSGNHPSIRYTDIILLWNILRHSYPYQEDISIPQDSILEFGLMESSKKQSDVDFYRLLQQFSSHYNDGHLMTSFLAFPDSLKEGVMPLVLDWVEKKVIVREVIDSVFIDQIKPGDILESIDGISIDELFSKHRGMISGSPQWKDFKAVLNLTSGALNTTGTVVLKRDEMSISASLPRDQPIMQYRRGNFSSKEPATGWIKENVMYLNLTKDTTAAIQHWLAKCDEETRAIIIDLRGYLMDGGAHDLPNYFVKKEVTLNDRFFVPRILYPDFEAVTYDASGRKTFSPPKNIINAKVFLLIDASAQSASETVISEFQDLKLATLVGLPTSGTNGNINITTLPGRYQISFSGMKVTNGDGSKHHMVGILPDIKVEKTIEGVTNGTDEVLQKALSLCK